MNGGNGNGITVRNICGNKLGITNPETKIVRNFPINGQKTMNIEEIRNLYWSDDGFAYMIREKYLELVNAPEDLLADLDLLDNTAAKKPADLVKLDAATFEATLPTLSAGERSALQTYLQNEDFPISLAAAAKAFYGQDFLAIKQVKADAGADNKPNAFVRGK